MLLLHGLTELLPAQPQVCVRIARVKRRREGLQPHKPSYCEFEWSTTQHKLNMCLAVPHATVVQSDCSVTHLGDLLMLLLLLLLLLLELYLLLQVVGVLLLLACPGIGTAAKHATVSLCHGTIICSLPGSSILQQCVTSHMDSFNDYTSRHIDQFSDGAKPSPPNTAAYLLSPHLVFQVRRVLLSSPLLSVCATSQHTHRVPSLVTRLCTCTILRFLLACGQRVQGRRSTERAVVGFYRARLAVAADRVTITDLFGPHLVLEVCCVLLSASLFSVSATSQYTHGVASHVARLCTGDLLRLLARTTRHDARPLG